MNFDDICTLSFFFENKLENQSLFTYSSRRNSGTSATVVPPLCLALNSFCLVVCRYLCFLLVCSPTQYHELRAGVNILPQIIKLFPDNFRNFPVFPYKTSLITEFYRNFSLIIISLNGKIFLTSLHSPIIFLARVFL